jgi:hypothetical protein
MLIFKCCKNEKKKIDNKTKNIKIENTISSNDKSLNINCNNNDQNQNQDKKLNIKEKYIKNLYDKKK